MRLLAKVKLLMLLSVLGAQLTARKAARGASVNTN
jgi:hypothetical protein